MSGHLYRFDHYSIVPLGELYFLDDRDFLYRIQNNALVRVPVKHNGTVRLKVDMTDERNQRAMQWRQFFKGAQFVDGCLEVNLARVVEFVRGEIERYRHLGKESDILYPGLY